MRYGPTLMLASTTKFGNIEFPRSTARDVVVVRRGGFEQSGSGSLVVAVMLL